MTQRAILCADDFGLTDGVSAAILELAAAGKLSATSVLVTPDGWQRNADALAGLSPRLAIALHLNLTLGKPLGPMPRFASRGFPPLARVIAGALTKTLPLSEIENEFDRQIACFVDQFGRLPDLVDGHQHVHILPGIRDAMLRSLSRVDAHRSTVLRDCADAPRSIINRGRFVGKAMLVSTLSAGFSAAADRADFRTTMGFSGVCNFAPSIKAVARDFAAAFRMLGARHVIMCHPGRADRELAAVDRVVERRALEFRHVMRDDSIAERIIHFARDRHDRVIWPMLPPRHIVDTTDV